MAGKTVPLEEFMKEPLLSREKSSGAYEVFQSAVNQTGLTVTPVWESTSQTTLMEAVHYGLGVTILPEQMIISLYIVYTIYRLTMFLAVYFFNIIS